MGENWNQDYLSYFLHDCEKELPLRKIKKEDQSLIAKYLSLPKLIYLLSFSELYFCRLDKFQDAYEGNVMFGIDQMKSLEDWRTMFSINCWNLYPDVESFPLWKIYLEGNYGVAIISTISSVYSSFNGDRSDDIGAHPVNYIYHNCPPKEAADPYTNAITKKEFYIFEQKRPK